MGILSEGMKRSKVQTSIESYGRYSAWDRESKDLPEILEFTQQIPARIGVEFGYILHIEQGKGQKLKFTIHHPPFLDETGQVSPPFTGELYIKSNPWDFFLGDTIWEPVDDKLGTWRLVVEIEGEERADMSFELLAEDSNGPR